MEETQYNSVIDEFKKMCKAFKMEITHEEKEDLMYTVFEFPSGFCIGIQADEGYEKPTYDVSKVVTTPGTYWDPPDTDISTFFETTDPYAAIRAMLIAEKEEEIGNMCESYYMEQSYKEPMEGDLT